MREHLWVFIIRKMIENEVGRIEVKSEVGKGADH